MTTETPKEITVIIKGEEATYRQKFLSYSPISLDLKDTVLADLVREAKEHYQGDIDEIKVRIALQWL